MPRGRDTVYANMSFNAREPQIRAAVEQAEANEIALGTYLKKLVLALLAQGPLLLLPFREVSRVLTHLQHEADELEMPLDTYVVALLADRDRSLYESQCRPGSLWYPRGHVIAETSFSSGEMEEEQGEDDVNIEEAMSNVNDFLSEMSNF